jgi:hypothetical protein
MTFEVPENLGQYSLAGLKDLIKQAEAEYTTTIESITADTVTDEDLDYLEELQTFAKVTGPAELQGRTDRAARYASLTEPTPEPEPEPVAEEPTPEPEPVTAGSVIKVGIADIANRDGSPVVPLDRPRYSTLVAATGVPDFEAGTELKTMLDVAKAFESRSRSHGALGGGRGQGPIMYPVAQLVRNYPDEFSVNGDETDYAKLLHVADETRLPGGSLLRSTEQRMKEMATTHPERALVAAAGWCAPSETDYDICLQITTDGLYDAPEVQARRGGIRHNTGIEFDSIFGGGNCSAPSGFFNLTEAQVAAGTTKTCLEIPCPDFVDTRLGVTGLCLTGNILSIRGYPEFTATFTRGAVASSAHQVNREQIAAVVAGSTAVTLTGFPPWATDLSVVSQVLSAVEMAIVDIKYRLRMMQSATLEVVFPFWLLAQMRADWVRRNGTGNGPEAITLADSAIQAAFSARGARTQWVYDWQDAFATCAASGVPGADTPITELPTSLQFLVYPAGTWIRALNDVITLNSVYDSTKLATNQVTHLFTETGWAMLKMCPVSRVYTVPICPNGKTGLQRDVTC